MLHFMFYILLNINILNNIIYFKSKIELYRNLYILLLSSSAVVNTLTTEYISLSLYAH